MIDNITTQQPLNTQVGSLANPAMLRRAYSSSRSFTQPTGDISNLHFKSETQLYVAENVKEKDTDTIENTVFANPSANQQVTTLPTKSIKKAATKGDTKAQKIRRIHFANLILRDIENIQQNIKYSTFVIYANSLLHNMLTMRDLLPYDPYTEVIMALYEALAFENTWKNYTFEQYEGAYQLLKNLAKVDKCTNEKVEKAIIKLEHLGFNTTPF